MDLISNNLNGPNVYSCLLCNFSSTNRKDYKKHLETVKHQKAENPSDSYTDRKISCICGKLYKTNSGLYKHKKICVYEPNYNKELTTNDVIIMYLLKQNLDHQFTIMELNKKVNSFFK